MTDGPYNYEFKQQLAALSLLDQLLVLAWIRLRLSSRQRRRRWIIENADVLIIG